MASDIKNKQTKVQSVFIKVSQWNTALPTFLKLRLCLSLISDLMSLSFAPIIQQQRLDWWDLHGPIIA